MEKFFCQYLLSKLDVHVDVCKEILHWYILKVTVTYRCKMLFRFNFFFYIYVRATCIKLTAKIPLFSQYLQRRFVKLNICLEKAESMRQCFCHTLGKIATCQLHLMFWIHVTTNNIFDQSQMPPLNIVSYLWKSKKLSSLQLKAICTSFSHNAFSVVYLPVFYLAISVVDTCVYAYSLTQAHPLHAHSFP